MALSGKVFAVTGGASGIGLATAQILAKRGTTICIADFELLKAPFTITRVDVSKRDDVDSWIDGIIQKYGRLDGAANVAGIIGKHHGVREVADPDDDEWHKIIAVNLTGTMYCLRAQLGKVVNGGSIVNLTISLGFAKYGAYDAREHGVIGLTKAAAKENGNREVRVNAVAPGAIYTPLMEQAWKIHDRPSDAPFDDTAAFQRQGTAEECGHVIAFLLGPDSKYVSGSVYSANGAM
ncbi:short-chain dehydrogenase [Biscogniauxia mediterranea]|nr:short-chain dehydrogenase [Biscogniauxia mediterranea]